METQKEKAVKLYHKDPRKALAFCKKWHDLGKHRSEIVRGAECMTNARFYSQLGFDTDACIADATVKLGQHLGILPA